MTGWPLMLLRQKYVTPGWRVLSLQKTFPFADCALNPFADPVEASDVWAIRPLELPALVPA